MQNQYTLREFYYQVFDLHYASTDIKTRDSRKHLMEQYIFPFIGDQLLAEIDGEQINYVYSLYPGMGLSESTTYLINNVLRRLFTLASSMGHVPQDQNPCYYKSRRSPNSCRLVPHPQSSPYWYTLAELQRITESLCLAEDSQLFRLVLHSGIKNEEFNALRISDYDTVNKSLSIHRVMKYTSRNKKEFGFFDLPEDDRKKRTIFLSKPAQEAIEEAIDMAIARPVPPNELDIRDRYIYRDSRNRLLSNLDLYFSAQIIKQAAGIEKLTFRTLRSNFIIMCFRCGWEEPQVMRYTGIATPNNILNHKRIATATATAFT